MPIFNSALAGGAAASNTSTGVKLISKTAKATKAVLRHTYSASSISTYTVSMWFKRGELNTEQYLFGSNGGGFGFTEGNRFVFRNTAGLTFQQDHFVDTSAWSHLVVSITSGNFKAYLNGQLFAENLILNDSPPLAGSGEHVVIFGKSDTNEPFAGKIGRVECVPSERVPTDFGFYDEYNVWQPKVFTSGYGDLGFKLEFLSNTVGADTSGNDNDFTVVNTDTQNSTNTVTLTVDSPTDDTEETDDCNGAEIAGNYPVFQILDRTEDTTYGEHANVVSSDNTAIHTHYTTMAIDSNNAYYAEFLCAVGSHFEIGISSVDIDVRDKELRLGKGASYKHNGIVTYSTSTSAYGTNDTSTTFGAGDTIGVLVDLKSQNQVVEFYKINNSGTQLVYTVTNHFNLDAYKWVFAVTTKDSSIKANFGETSFESNAGAASNKNPKCLCSTSLAACEVIEGRTRVNCINYTGGAYIPYNIDSLKFKPALVWIKENSNNSKHFLVDRIRGANKLISFGDVTQENIGNSLTSFDDNGFTLGSNNKLNRNDRNYTAWCWGAPDTETTTTTNGKYKEISNEDGGFAVLKDELEDDRIDLPHSLGEAPKFFIYKIYNKEKNWFAYHTSAGPNFGIGFGHKGISNTTGHVGNTLWQNKRPDDDEIFIGKHANVNATNKDFILYAWREVPGFSRFGKFKAADGDPDEQFVYCGFRPSVVMIRPTVDEKHWFLMYTREHERYNILTKYYNFQEKDAEESEADGLVMFTTSGFKMEKNLPEDEYYYMAWGDWPTKYSRAY